MVKRTSDAFVLGHNVNHNFVRFPLFADQSPITPQAFPLRAQCVTRPWSRQIAIVRNSGHELGKNVVALVVLLVA